MWTLLDQGLSPLHWKHIVLTTGSLGKSIFGVWSEQKLQENDSRKVTILEQIELPAFFNS